MSSAATTPPDGLRERVQFYLLDHRTPVGKAIDIALLALNLVFVAVFVAQTYSLGSTATARLWTLEVLIAAVFAVEYAFRSTSRGTGWQRSPIRTRSSTCCRYSRRSSLSSIRSR